MAAFKAQPIYTCRYEYLFGTTEYRGPEWMVTRSKRPNCNDVARQANVSGWTVSQVLNTRSEYPINEDTRRRVLVAARELGYRPNHMARALVTGKMGLVALWMHRLSPYYSLVARHVQNQLRSQGLPLLVTEIEQTAEDVTEPSWAVDGIIAVEFPEYVRVFLASHPDLVVPFVSMGTRYIDDRDYVGIDLADGVHAAMAHLFSLGRQRIVFVVDRDPLIQQETRFDIYTDFMVQAGLKPNYLQAPTRQIARQGIQDWIRREGVPEAVFCHNDDFAVGIYRGLCELGVRVPDDVALVGCDGLEEAEYLERPLTTIVQPVETMCALAWEYLQRRIADPTIPAQQIVLKPELVIRDSTVRSG